MEEIKRTMEEPKELRLGDILHTISVYCVNIKLG